MVSTVSFAMQSPLQQDLLEVKPTVVHEKAFIIIVRHGEKHHGDGLSPTGVKRSEYLARCMSQEQGWGKKKTGAGLGNLCLLFKA